MFNTNELIERRAVKEQNEQAGLVADRAFQGLEDLESPPIDPIHRMHTKMLSAASLEALNTFRPHGAKLNPSCRVDDDIFGKIKGISVNCASSSDLQAVMNICRQTNTERIHFHYTSVVAPQLDDSAFEKLCRAKITSQHPQVGLTFFRHNNRSDNPWIRDYLIHAKSSEGTPLCVRQFTGVENVDRPSGTELQSLPTPVFTTLLIDGGGFWNFDETCLVSAHTVQRMVEHAEGWARGSVKTKNGAVPFVLKLSAVSSNLLADDLEHMDGEVHTVLQRIKESIYLTQKIDISPLRKKDIDIQIGTLIGNEMLPLNYDRQTAYQTVIRELERLYGRTVTVIGDLNREHGGLPSAHLDYFVRPVLDKHGAVNIFVASESVGLELLRSSGARQAAKIMSRLKDIRRSSTMIDTMELQEDKSVSVKAGKSNLSSLDESYKQLLLHYLSERLTQNVPSETEKLLDQIADQIGKKFPVKRFAALCPKEPLPNYPYSTVKEDHRIWFSDSNGLIENTNNMRHAYLPTYGLKPIEDYNDNLFRSMGYQVTRVPGLTSHPRKGGSLHCLTREWR